MGCETGLGVVMICSEEDTGLGELMMIAGDEVEGQRGFGEGEGLIDAVSADGRGEFSPRDIRGRR